MPKPQCQHPRPSGEPCLAPPLRDQPFCIMHHPDHAQEILEARRLGGMRRKREATIGTAYEFSGLRTIEEIQRLLEIAVTDTLGMENSIARSRTLAYLAQVALKALEVGEMEERLRTLEAAVTGKAPAPVPIFGVETLDDLGPPLLGEKAS